MFSAEDGEHHLAAGDELHGPQLEEPREVPVELLLVQFDHCRRRRCPDADLAFVHVLAFQELLGDLCFRSMQKVDMIFYHKKVTDT